MSIGGKGYEFARRLLSPVGYALHAEAARAAGGPGYKYHAVVRRKADRELLRGFE